MSIWLCIVLLLAIRTQVLWLNITWLPHFDERPTYMYVVCNIQCPKSFWAKLVCYYNHKTNVEKIWGLSYMDFWGLVSTAAGSGDIKTNHVSNLGLSIYCQQKVVANSCDVKMLGNRAGGIINFLHWIFIFHCTSWGFKERKPNTEGWDLPGDLLFVCLFSDVTWFDWVT